MGLRSRNRLSIAASVTVGLGAFLFAAGLLLGVPKALTATAPVLYRILTRGVWQFTLVFT